MLHAGAIAENPRSGVRAIIRQTQVETQGNGFQIEFFCRPYAGPDLPAHMHEWWTEKFDILSGTCTYLLDSAQLTGKPGDTITLPPGKIHIHPWNAGDDELHMIQTDIFGHASPQAAIDTLNTVASAYGLVRDGKIGPSGRPNPLQQAVMMQTLMNYDGYLATPSPAAQRLIFGLLGAIGRAVGYRSSYPQYTNG